MEIFITYGYSFNVKLYRVIQNHYSSKLQTKNHHLCDGLMMAPRGGFEPTTKGLTVLCSTTELPRNSKLCRNTIVLCQDGQDVENIPETLAIFAILRYSQRNFLWNTAM